ncbi:MAG: hypothetical protein R3C61_04155 [Bacteroidia bacterium]
MQPEDQNANQFSWNFGDRHVNGNQSVTDFVGAGLYSVQLIVCNSVCSPLRCDTEIPVIVIDTAQIAANFMPSTPTTCVGDAVAFSNFSVNADQYSWNLAMALLRAGRALCLAGTGTYTVTLVSFWFGVIRYLQRTLVVVPIPVAFAGGDTVINQGQYSFQLREAALVNAVYVWAFDLTLSCLLCKNR